MDSVSRKQRSANMRRVRGAHTKPEIFVRKWLHKNGYRFRLHRKDLAGKPDIVLPKFKATIFVNGCFWHGHDCPRGKRPSSNTEFWNKKLDRNIQRDQANYADLKANGWHVLILWECDLRKRHDHTLERLRHSLDELHSSNLAQSRFNPRASSHA
ncbi:MAG: very short patch repair endonuclease [Pseudomonadota bacterium]